MPTTNFPQAKKIEHIVCLNGDDLDKLDLSMRDIVDLLSDMFIARATQQMVNPPKIFEHRSNTRLYSSMVSFAPSLGFASCKWQSGDADNPKRGLPLIQGLLLLSEDETGQPVALMDAKWITGERTAAASALLARHQARENAQTLGIIGCGLQARKHLQSITEAVPSLRQCLLYDIIEAKTAAFVEEMSGQYDIELIAARSARDVVAPADIIISGAPIVANPQPVIAPDWVKPGALGISIDYDASWQPATVASMDIVLSDDRGQLLDEKNKGHFEGVDRIDADICQMLTEDLGLRRNEQQKILGYNLGIALEDLAVSAELYKRALAKNDGVRVAM